MSFERALHTVLVREGGYVNDKADRGGATNKGITQKVYDAWRRSHALPIRSVADIEDAEVAAIYLTQYWNPAQCGKLPEALGIVHFDAAVNHGVRRAIKFLQLAVGASDDGVIGKETMRLLAANDEEATINAYLDRRLDFYEDIVEKDPTQVRFISGWKNRIRSLRNEVG